MLSFAASFLDVPAEGPLTAVSSLTPLAPPLMLMDEQKTRKAENAFDWDTRGLFLRSMELSFFASAPPGSWARLIDECKLQVEDAPLTSPLTFPGAVFAALPAELKRNALYLAGRVHAAPQEEGATDESAHWHFQWERAPTSNPPKRLAEQSARLGGHAQFLQSLCDHWPTSQEVTMRVTATYMALELPLLPEIAKSSRRRAKRFIVKSNGKEIELAPETSITIWRAKPPSGPIEELSISPPRNKITAFTTHGKQRMRVTTDILSEMDRYIWSGLQAFLTEHASAP